MKPINFALITKNHNRTVDGLDPVHLRIQLQGGKPRFISTGEFVDPVKWKKTKHFKNVRVGSDEEIQRKQMLTFIDRAQDYFDEGVNKGKKPTIDQILDHLNGKAITPVKIEDKTFFQCYNEYEAMFNKLVVGGKRVKATFNKFNSMKLQLESYLIELIGKADINLSEIQKPFLPNFYKHLLGKVNCETANNYIKAFKLIIDYAVEQEYLQFYPFTKLKREYDKKEVETNTPAEFKLLLTKQIANAYLDEARDIYVFACTTGFSFIDLYNLTGNHLEKFSFDKCRQKTDIKALPILTDVAKKIIAKYKNHPVCLKRGTLLPVPDNASLNARLKLVGAVCEIKTKLNIHKGRHFFGETLKNSDIKENIHQAMMGHKEGSRQTARYGKTKKETVIGKKNEVKEIFRKIA